MRKRILFRADGNSTSGLGHLYRIFALIEMYKDNFDCLILTKENSTTAVIPHTYAFKTIPESINTEREPDWLSQHYDAESSWVVADGYHFTSAWQKKIKALNYKLIYIDDLCTEHMYADVVINHSLSVSSSNYSAEPYTTLALGTSYAILRPLFLEAAKIKRSINSIETAFICFGGADALNLTLKATEALLCINTIKNIHVVIGAAYNHPEIFTLAKKQSGVRVHQNISETELITVMKSCDMAIAPSSNILYEVCAVKMPVLSGYYVENQKNIYKGSVQKQIIFDGGNFESYTVKDFQEKVTALIDEKKYQNYIDAQSNLFDEKIKTRFLCLLTKPSYRRAVEKDMLLVFNWANDQLSRANSYFSDSITLETHKNWFEKKLRDPNCFIYIAEIQGAPAGMVRYEISGDTAVVGILVGDNFRGKGLASEFLTSTAELYFEGNTPSILAYIKKNNTASVKSFEKAGYKKIRDEIVHGHESVLYKLENHDVQ